MATIIFPNSPPLVALLSFSKFLSDLWRRTTLYGEGGIGWWCLCEQGRCDVDCLAPSLLYPTPLTSLTYFISSNASRMEISFSYYPFLLLSALFSVLLRNIGLRIENCVCVFVCLCFKTPCFSTKCSFLLHRIRNWCSDFVVTIATTLRTTRLWSHQLQHEVYSRNVTTIAINIWI